MEDKITMIKHREHKWRGDFPQLSNTRGAANTPVEVGAAESRAWAAHRRAATVTSAASRRLKTEVLDGDSVAGRKRREKKLK